MQQIVRMANHNGRTERDDAREFSNRQYQNFQADSDNTEHGYQDPRDQRERQPSRDDVRGGELANRNFQTTDRTGDRSPRGIRGLSQAVDEFAERSLHGERDAQPSNERGQSGVQAGGHGPGAYRGPASRGGNDGRWGDFDRGGRSIRAYGDSQDNNRDDFTQTLPYREQDPRAQRYEELQQRWSAERSRGPHAGKGPKGFVRSDERISELVHEVLTDHEHIDASNISLTVKDGEVTLTGHVDNRNAKLQAEDLVATVIGVKEIHNQIRVGAVSSSTGSSHVEIPNDDGKTESRRPS